MAALYYQTSDTNPTWRMKDSQEIERIVEEFESTWSDFIGDIEFGEAFAHLAQDPEVPFVLPEMAHWLRTTLTTYGNARAVEAVEKVEKGVPEAIYLPVESTENGHLKAVGSNLLRKAVVDHIAAIKSELK
jgi:hypothetical protein